MHSTAQTAKTIIYGAGAGTGKTYTLTQAYVDAITNGGRFADMIEPEQIIATTFTNAAAAELRSRVRSSLLERNLISSASAVMGGYIGTVNAISARLLNEFGLTAGFAPSSAVIPEELSLALFRKSACRALEVASAKLRALNDRLSVENWEEDVFALAQLARVSCIEFLGEHCRQSWGALRPYLDEPSQRNLEKELLELLTKAFDQLNSQSDGKKITGEALEIMRVSIRCLKTRQALPWKEWIKLTKMHASAKLDWILNSVRQHANLHIANPQLIEDLRQFMETIFECAEAAMAEYDSYKRARGLFDFVDQERLCAELLQHNDVRARLRDQFKLLLVDEFQDTSPLQLGIFTELASLVDNVVWVGDEKQAIYGFRGADADLMTRTCDRLVQSGNARRVEHTINFRAVPNLVRFSNCAFRVPMEDCGITGKYTELSANRSDLPCETQSVQLWRLGAGNWDECLQSLASAVLALLNGDDAWMVCDRASGDFRAVRPGDLAILCRSNDRRMQIAQAFAANGIQVDTERAGLMQTAEVLRTLAALRYLVDAADTVAVAELARLDSPETWLSIWLDQGIAAVKEASPYVAALDKIRSRAVQLTPREMLEHAITYGGALDMISTSLTASSAFANIDRLRGLARQFEQHCLVRNESCTSAAMVRFLNSECAGACQPGVASEDAVSVMTYHKSKGLEWPVVIMLDLQQVDEQELFGPQTVVLNNNDTDSAQGVSELRGIRYWPWPYGRHRKNTILYERIQDSELGKAHGARFRSEQLRLLYVGMTRARDYLVLAGKNSPTGFSWIERLECRADKTLPQQGESCKLNDFDIHVREFCEVLPTPVSRADSAVFSSTFVEPVKFAAFTIVASSSTEVLHVGNDISWFSVGDRLFSRPVTDRMLFGDALHQFFATTFADGIVGSAVHSASVAADVLARFGCDVSYGADCVKASRRLELFLAKRFPHARLRTEVPIYGRIAMQRARGFMDLLAETRLGTAIIDHKTFPGRKENLNVHLREYIAQLQTYVQLSQSVGLQSPITEAWIHFPTLGKICVVPVDSSSR